jgi:two-component sensor histidine kinase
MEKRERINHAAAGSKQMMPADMGYLNTGLDELPSSGNLLLAELTHRVTNEYTAAIAILTLMITQTIHTDVKLALLDVRTCLANFARVHRALQKPQIRRTIDALAYLQELCQAMELSRLKQRGIKLHLVGRPLQIDSECCWRLGMIVCELVAHLSRACAESEGEIVIEIYESAGTLNCEVRDNISTMSQSIETEHGLRIIHGLLVDLHGDIEQRFETGGSTTHLAFSAHSG